MELNLTRKRALVGGSTAGMGKAIAIAFSQAGGKITLIARSEAKLKATIQELHGDHSDHDYLVANFEEPKVVKNEIENYLSGGNVVDILVNNTGGPPAGPLLEAAPEDFLKALNMHLLCNHILTRHVVEGMRKNNWGRIINIVSTSVRQPIDNLGVSNTTRGAVGNWAKTLANEMGPFGITVNNILPGPIRTQRLMSLMEKWAERRNSTPDQEEERMIQSVPLRRVGEPEEIANAALFLASEASSYITGTNLVVDGGRTKCY